MSGKLEELVDDALESLAIASSAFALAAGVTASGGCLAESNDRERFNAAVAKVAATLRCIREHLASLETPASEPGVLPALAGHLTPHDVERFEAHKAIQRATSDARTCADRLFFFVERAFLIPLVERGAPSAESARTFGSTRDLYVSLLSAIENVRATSAVRLLGRVGHSDDDAPLSSPPLRSSARDGSPRFSRSRPPLRRFAVEADRALPIDERRTRSRRERKKAGNDSEGGRDG